jgi:CBS domain-containing protein
VTATKVGDICSKKVITISEETTLTDIATIMAEKKVHILPVVQAGKVVGVVGKRDVVKAVAQRAG